MKMYIVYDPISFNLFSGSIQQADSSFNTSLASFASIASTTKFNLVFDLFITS